MKIKSLAAVLLATFAVTTASAVTATPVTVFSAPIVGNSFTDWVVGNITVASLSKLTDSMFAADTISGSASEPESSTMMLLGLVMMGVIMRRRARSTSV